MGLPAHKIFVLIAYVEKPPPDAYVEFSSGARSRECIPKH